MTAETGIASPPSSSSPPFTTSVDLASATRPPAASFSLSQPTSHSSFSAYWPYSQSSSRAHVASSRSWKTNAAAGPPVQPIHIPPPRAADNPAHMLPVLIRQLPALSALTAAPARSEQSSSPLSGTRAHSGRTSLSAAVSESAALSIFRNPYVTPLFLARFLSATSTSASSPSPVARTIASSLTGSPPYLSSARPPPLVVRSEVQRQRRLTPLRREWTLRDSTKRRPAVREKSHDGSQKLSSLLQRVLVIRDQYTNPTVSAASVSADFAYSSSATSLPTTMAPTTHTGLSSSPPALSPFLTFRDVTLEASYRSDFLARHFPSLRLAVLLSCVMWLLFAITDIVKWLSGARASFVETIALRFAVAFLVVAPTSLTYSDRVRRRVTVKVLKGALCTFILLFGACQVQFGVLQGDTLDPTYSTFIILLSSMSASWFRLPCFLSIACNLLLCGIFVVMTAASGCYDTSSSFIAAAVWIVIAIVLFSFHAYGIELNMRKTYLAAQQLSEQEQRSQRVLATMLPLRVISELRTARAFVCERHEHVSVLFSHVHEFDRVTAELAARQVVELLNGLFSRFDLLTDLLGVYKVETIGDVYLVSAGVPDRLERHACVLALLALCMMEEMRSLADSLQLALQHLRLRLRVGLHSGPVIAGVVGVKYPRFRLMGDTVNTASRMSTTCQPSQIQLSQATFQLLSDRFVCRYNGRVSVKGKGPMDTYMLRYVLPAEGSVAFLPISVDEACGDKTAHQVAAELGCSLPTSSALHTRAGSLNARMELSTRPDAAEQRHDLLELPAPLDVIAARELSAPLPSTPPADPIPFYHSRPIAGCLYSNSRVEANVLSFEADDVHAVLADASSGASVHRLHRLRGAEQHSEEEELRKPLDNEEKEQVAVAMAVSPHERYTASRIVEADQQYRHTVRLVAIEPTQWVEQKESSRPHSSSDSGSDSDTSLTPPQLGEDSAASATPSSVTSEPQAAVTSVVVSAVTTKSPASPSPAASPLSHASSVDELPSPVLLPPAAPLTHSVSQSDPQPADPPPASSIYTISATAVSVSFLHAVPTLSELQHTNPLRLAFHRHPHLESAFQSEWSTRTLRVTRRGIVTLMACVVVLGCYDTYVDWPVGGWGVVAMTWGLRLVAVVVGCGVIGVSYWWRVRYCRYQQWLVFVCWTLIAMLQCIIGVLLPVSTSSHEVTTTLILITSTSFFVGLQFRFVALSTLLQLLFYVVAELTQRGDILNAFFLLASAILSMLSAHSAEHFQRLDYIGYLRLDSDEKNTREILEQMLPAPVMNDIMKQQLGGGGSGPVVAHDVSMASVLFCDIVSFTSLAASVSAEDVVAILNIVFSTFDALTTRHKVYKVETIGDAYLACSGVVQPAPSSGTSAHSAAVTVPSHTENLVKCALDFQSASQYFRTPNNSAISVRIGIHTGPVIAGVVGRKMPRYHLFGETVTLAEEMEHSGLAGSVIVSGETHRQVGDSFSCRPMSELLWKGGVIARWKVLHCRTELGVYAGEGGGEWEGGLPSLPGVVSDILYKVHESNVREQEARERRWFGSDGSTVQRAADKLQLEATSDRLIVQVLASTLNTRLDVLSSVVVPWDCGRDVGLGGVGRRRVMSETLPLTRPVSALRLLGEDVQPSSPQTPLSHISTDSGILVH